MLDFFPVGLHPDLDGLTVVSMFSSRIVYASFLAHVPQFHCVRLSKLLIPDKLDFLGGFRGENGRKASGLLLRQNEGQSLLESP